MAVFFPFGHPTLYAYAVDVSLSVDVAIALEQARISCIPMGGAEDLWPSNFGKVF
jgi:hypothetical protein